MAKTKKHLSDRYQRLAKYLNTLPAGFPPTESGVEIELLKKLFTPEQAALALHLRLISEPSSVIARRAGLPRKSTADLLAEMAEKGLIAAQIDEGGAAHYAVSQFVIGFWEGQVDRLDEETVQLFEAYGPIWFKEGPWKTFPQVRTIPIQQTIPLTTEVMAYENAETILQTKTLIAAQNCICRQEQALLGHGCGKPLETCLSFDNAARSTIALGRGREISLEEALELLRQAQRAGLVLQPANSQNPIFMCACCDCCCGVLRQVKLEPEPASLVMSAFIANFDPNPCTRCGACLKICPMAALVEGPGGEVIFDPARCIGCGLCTSRCPSGALKLVRKETKTQPRIPANTTSTYLRLAAKRGPGTLFANGWLIFKSWVENLFSKH